jgi:hypothetical protein
MDLNLGPVFVYLGIILAVTFLVGFSSTFLAGMLIHRRYTKSLIRYRKLPIILISGLSILGGVAVVNILFAWDRAEQKAQSERRSAFVKHMQEAYPLELRVDLESPEPFTIVFSVPRDGEYWITVLGYFAKETDYAHRYGGEKVIEIRESLLLRQGKNSFSFAFNEGIDLSTSRNLDLVVRIKPRFPHEQLLNTRKGILVSNSGEVELSEGINYYASDYDGCWISVSHVACAKYDPLYVDLSQ